MYSLERIRCPHCKDIIQIGVHIDDPKDGDQITKEATCHCGCVFKQTGEVVIEIDFNFFEPEIITPGIDPNQLSLL